VTSGVQPGVPRTAAVKRILSSGHNTALLRIRNSFIETAGYQVVTTKESAVLLELAGKQRFDAVVLCSSIPAHVQEHTARELKKLQPHVPLIIICQEDDRARFNGLGDATVVSEQGVSQPLMEAIFRLAGDPDE
jgi:DNA-binding NarL/FixJ family response regulator